MESSEATHKEEEPTLSVDLVKLDEPFTPFPNVEEFFVVPESPKCIRKPFRSITSDDTCVAMETPLPEAKGLSLGRIPANTLGRCSPPKGLRPTVSPSPV